MFMLRAKIILISKEDKKYLQFSQNFKITKNPNTIITLATDPKGSAKN